MLVVLKRVNFLPVLVPVKHPDGVVVTTGEYIGLGGMNSDVPDVVFVLLDCLDLLSGVVVKHAQQVIVRTHNYLLFTGDESSTPNWRIRDL